MGGVHGYVLTPVTITVDVPDAPKRRNIVTANAVWVYLDICSNRLPGTIQPGDRSTGDQTHPETTIISGWLNAATANIGSR